MICKEVSDRIRGCLFGGAAGDALGYPVEFLWIDDIRKRYGPGGIQSYDFDGRTGKALISDDTQMTLFTADGILSGLTQNRLNGTSIPLRKYVESAYADWLSTQRLGAQPPQPVVAAASCNTRSCTAAERRETPVCRRWPSVRSAASRTLSPLR